MQYLSDRVTKKDDSRLTEKQWQQVERPAELGAELTLSLEVPNGAAVITSE